MPTTPNLALPYPASGDSPDGPAQIQALALALDAAIPVRAPAGTIRATIKAAADTGWLTCDGASVAKATYPALDAILSAAGYPFGSTSTNFTLPDLRGRVPVGVGTHADVDALGDSDGLAVGSRRPSHAHADGSLAAASHSHADGTLSAVSHSHGDGTLAAASHTHDDGTLSAASHTHADGSLSTAATSDTVAISLPASGTSLTIPTQTHTHDVTGATGAASPDVAGLTGSSGADVTGSTAAATADVTGDTSAVGADVAGTTSDASPSYLAVHYQIKT